MNIAQMLMHGPMLTSKPDGLNAKGTRSGMKTKENADIYSENARRKRHAKYRVEFLKHPDYIMDTAQLSAAFGLSNGSIGRIMRGMCEDTPPVIARLKSRRRKGCSRDVNVYQWIGD